MDLANHETTKSRHVKRGVPRKRATRKRTARKVEDPFFLASEKLRDSEFESENEKTSEDENKSEKFYDIIPKTFKDTSQINYLIKDETQKNNFINLKKCAYELDECMQDEEDDWFGGPEQYIVDAVYKYREELREHCFALIDSLEKEDGEDDCVDSAVKLKLNKIAINMVNKVVSKSEIAGSFSGVDEQGNEIKKEKDRINKTKLIKLIDPGAYNVDEDMSLSQHLDYLDSLDSLEYIDCRHKELFEHKPTADDCKQTGLENCNLKDTLISILDKIGPQPILNMFKDEGSSGCVQVRLFIPTHYTKSELIWTPIYCRVPKKILMYKETYETICRKKAYWVQYLQVAVTQNNTVYTMLTKKQDEKEPDLCDKIILGISAHEREKSLLSLIKNHIEISTNEDTYKELIPKIFIEQSDILIKDKHQRDIFDKIYNYTHCLDKLFLDELDKNEICKSAEELKKQCFALIDSLGEVDDEVDVVGSKLKLIATNIINRVVSELEGGVGTFEGTDVNGKNIYEGAKDVTLNLGTESLKKDDEEEEEEEEEEDDEIIYNSSVRYLDVRHKKLFEHKPNTNDVVRRSSSSWLDNILFKILRKKNGSKKIENMFKDEGASGYVQVMLYYPKYIKRKGNMVDCIWEPKYYRVPKKIPVDKNDKYIYDKSRAYWVHYLQAAIAKSNIINKEQDRNLTIKEDGNNKIRDYASAEIGYSNSRSSSYVKTFAEHMLLGISKKERKISLTNLVEEISVEASQKFYDVIPKLFNNLYNDLIENEYQKNMFINIIKYAKELDLLSDPRQEKRDEDKMYECEENLKEQCFALIDSLKKINDSDDQLEKAVRLKLNEIARKMINKVVWGLEDMGSFNGKDDYGNVIEEGAKDKILENDSLQYLDVRHKRLFEHEPSSSDCEGAWAGDNWLHSSLKDFFKNNGEPELIKDMFKDEGDSGYVQVRLYYPTSINSELLFWVWEPRYYRVPKKIPLDKSGQPLYNKGAYWVQYLQEAVAKSNIKNTVKQKCGRDNAFDDKKQLIGARMLGIDKKKYTEDLASWAERKIETSCEDKNFYDFGIIKTFESKLLRELFIKNKDQRNRVKLLTKLADELRMAILMDEDKEICKFAEDLKKQCFALIDSLENINDSDDLLVRTVGSKLNLIARNLINKVVSELEDSGSFSGVDEQGKEIKEDAKDVTLNLGTELRRQTDPNAKIKDSSLLKYQDCRHEKLFEHNPTARDCRQGYLGDCWLQSALISILTQKGPQPIKDMFKDEGSSGYVRVRLYYPENRTQDLLQWIWKPRYYRVPKKIPVDKNDKPVYNEGANWVHYLQAAVAKSDIRNIYYNKDRTKTDQNNNKTRDYSSVISGSADISWCMILGYSWKHINWKRGDHFVNKSNVAGQKDTIKVDEFYNLISQALTDNKLISISFNPDTLKHRDSDVGISGGEHMDRGLITHHELAVVGAEEIDGIKYIRLINPWDSRKGREYINYDKGKKGAQSVKKQSSFKENGDESSLLKATTACRHLKNLFISNL